MSIIHCKRQPKNSKNHTEKKKKLLKLCHQEGKSITYIENLSNELFYEIFDYLDGCEIYQSFSNLNHRFQNILSSSALHLKINLLPFLDTYIHYDCVNIISQQRHQIISLRFMYTLAIDRFFKLMNFNSSFSHLESLVFTGIKSDHLFKCLSNLDSLPRLLSLVLGIGYNLKHFNDIYRLIFKLPVLKYFTLLSEAYEPFIPLPIATNNQFSTIEYLNINHSCSLNDLVSILSYTPRLNCLTCRELIRSNENIVKEVTINLPYLKRICISECYVVFDTMEKFIKKISFRLQILRMITYWDVTYLDPDRWERFILEYMPDLREFCLQHHEFIDDDFEVTEYHALINRFTSSFWFMQQYIFELAIDINDWSWTEIIYSIYPYKRKWYELYEVMKIDHSQDIELVITAPFCREFKELFTDNTITLFTLLRITRLDVAYTEIFVGILIDLIHHLPNLDSVRLWSGSLLRPQCISDDQTSTLYLSSNANKITKVKIECLSELAQIQFLINLCPSIEYLEIGYLKDIDFKLFIKFILRKNLKFISHLYILCLGIQTANEKMIEELQEMIQFDKLCHDYTIKLLYKKIYLQWK